MVAPNMKRKKRARGSKGSSFQMIMYLVVIGCAFYYMSSSDDSFDENKSAERKPDYLRGTNNGIADNVSYSSLQEMDPNKEQLDSTSSFSEPGFAQENFVAPDKEVDLAKDEELNEIVQDLKENMVQAEAEEIEKEKKLILTEPLKMAEEHVEETMEYILQKNDVMAPLQGVEDMSNQVKERLEAVIDKEFNERSNQILQDKESELDVVAQEDREIFKSNEGIVNDLGTMEKILEKDMKNEIDEVAEDIKNHITEMTEKIEGEVIKGTFNIDVDDMQIKQAEADLQKHESDEELNELIENSPSEYTESLEVLSTVNQAMDEIQKAKENLAEDQRDKLDEFVGMLEEQTKSAVENLLSQEDKKLAGITVDHIVDKVNTQLEETALNEIEEQTEQILQEQTEVFAEEINDEEQFMADSADLALEIGKEKQRTIEEMSKEIKHSTEKIKETLQHKAAKLEQELLEEVGVEVDEEDVEEVNKEIQEEHDTELMEALMTSVHTVTEKNEATTEEEEDEDEADADDDSIEEDDEVEEDEDEADADDDSIEETDEVVEDEDEADAEDDSIEEDEEVEDEEADAEDDSIEEDEEVVEDEEEADAEDDSIEEDEEVVEDEEEADAEDDSIEEDEEVEDEEADVEDYSINEEDVEEGSGDESTKSDEELINAREEKELDLDEEEP